NSAYCGGGLVVCDGTIQNNIITHNSAVHMGGGLSACDGTIQNNTITNNSGGWYGGGLYDCVAYIYNCIISFNTNGGIYEYEQDSQYNPKEVKYCDFYGNTGGDYYDYDTGSWYKGTDVNNLPEVHDCFSTAPLFIAPANTDYHLQDGSPCIDAGDPDPEYNDGCRPPGKGTARNDIGAYGGPHNCGWLTAYYPFSTSEDGWGFSGTLAPFDPANFTWTAGRIGLSANGSTNCFSYWYSPDVQIEDGKLYRAKWRIGSSVSNPEACLQFRLRVNQKGSWACWDTVSHNNFYSKLPSASNPEDYDVFFNPVLTGTDDNQVVFCFDIMSFDSTADTSSWLYLEELIVDECGVSTSTEVMHYDFTGGNEGWQFAGAIPPYDVPINSSANAHLGLSPDGSTNCFSYWYSPDIGIEDGKVYRARFEMSSDVTEPDSAVQFRLRVNQKSSWQGWNRVVNSYNQQSPSASAWKIYDVIFNPNVTGTSDNLAVFSFDILSFDPADAITSWLYLESVELEEISISP
ncbi:hypothetical protein J7M23_03095, partial [Candidatus Sumerlaeota bacterium]|nr:hypothetical protein [Candidatus Sumerlaeota bacterium]